MKLRIVGLEEDAQDGRALAESFAKFLQERGIEGMAREFGPLQLTPDANGVSLDVPVEKLRAKFGDATRKTGGASNEIGLDEFLETYALPSDLSAYRRVTGLIGLYKKLYCL